MANVIDEQYYSVPSYYVYTRENYCRFMSQVTKNRNYHGLCLHENLEISTDLGRKQIKKS